SDHSNNWQAVAAGGLGMAALALLGESADAEMWLEEAIAQVKMLLDGGFDSEGAYFESPMYHKYAMNYMTPFATALLREGRENLFECRDGVLHKTCLYNLYMMEPTRDHFAAFNDGRRLAGRPPEALHPAGGYFARLASQYRDGLVQWLFHTMYGPGRKFPVWNFQHGHPDSIIWYDDTLPVENPDTSPRLALARHWPEHGRVALRTGWTDPNAILFAMECGEYGSHGHADQGTFVLTAYGEHLVDDTGYGGWEATSEAHSVVLIDGEGQRKGGMLGAIRDFLHTPAMDYFEADSTAAYSPAQRVQRHVLFMRPSYFVIVDDVRKDDAPHDYQWLLHSTVQLSTTQIQVRKPDEIALQAERAALEVRVLSPEAPRSQVVKKQGHTFLSVATPQKVDEATFFAVLYPTSAEHRMSTVTPVRTDSVVGAKVGDDVALWARGEEQWEHAGLKTDARFAACRSAPRSVLAKSARSVEWGGLGFRADQPVTAILTEDEARLVSSGPTSITFADGYLRSAGVYETDQDRDPANDKRVGKVDANGQVSLPAGAFTVRK
ncbi:MAG: heparinase II/III family protein, partial [Armatimonadota bacterium]